MTPRQFASQLAVHEEISKLMRGQKPDVGKNTPTGFIDQIQGW